MYKNLYIWNDMNEPSVFNGPEVINICILNVCTGKYFIYTGILLFVDPLSVEMR